MKKVYLEGPKNAKGTESTCIGFKVFEKYRFEISKNKGQRILTLLQNYKVDIYVEHTEYILKI